MLENKSDTGLGDEIDNLLSKYAKVPIWSHNSGHGIDWTQLKRDIQALISERIKEEKKEAYIEGYNKAREKYEAKYKITEGSTTQQLNF